MFCSCFESGLFCGFFETHRGELLKPIVEKFACKDIFYIHIFNRWDCVAQNQEQHTGMIMLNFQCKKVYNKEIDLWWSLHLWSELPFSQFSLPTYAGIGQPNTLFLTKNNYIGTERLQLTWKWRTILEQNQPQTFLHIT